VSLIIVTLVISFLVNIYFSCILDLYIGYYALSMSSNSKID